jgi:hypothetical protein
MDDTIHVELAGACDAVDLVDFLATRGLRGSATDVDDHCEIEVGFALDQASRLRQEFEAALASWLEARGRPLIPVSAHGHDYVLRPPSD